MEAVEGEEEEALEYLSSERNICHVVAIPSSEKRRSCSRQIGVKTRLLCIEKEVTVSSSQAEIAWNLFCVRGKHITDLPIYQNRFENNL